MGSKKETTVYIGLGGNIGESVTILKQALDHIKLIPEIHDLKVSSFYLTSPVSPIPQNDYVNAVCSLTTSLSADDLLQKLQAIEADLGKMPKSKEDPRIIDLDILLFGLEFYNTKYLEVPHPRWMERLFVLIPMSELTSEIAYPTKDRAIKTVNLKKYIEELRHFCNDSVTKIPNERYDETSFD